MKIGLSTLFCLSSSLKEAIEKLKDLNVQYIELTDDGFHTLTSNLIKLLKKSKNSYGWTFSVHAPFSDVNIAAHDTSLRRAILRRLKKSIKHASELEAEIWVFHPGATTALERYYPGRSWDINLEAIKILNRTAREYGVEAAIENVPEPFPFLMKSVDDFERFYSVFHEELGMVLDVAHANIQNETTRFIERFGKKIIHVHVSDNKKDWDTHLPLGHGNVDWVKTIKGLNKIGFSGTLIIESYEGINESLSLLRRLIN